MKIGHQDYSIIQELILLHYFC